MPQFIGVCLQASGALPLRESEKRLQRLSDTLLCFGPPGEDPRSDALCRIADVAVSSRCSLSAHVQGRSPFEKRHCGLKKFTGSLSPDLLVGRETLQKKLYSQRRYNRSNIMISARQFVRANGSCMGVR